MKRWLTALALGLMVFSVGLRAFHAQPFPAQFGAASSFVEASKTRSKACGLCVPPSPQLVIDPRAPSLAPPDARAGHFAAVVAAVPAAAPGAGRAIRAPPAA